MISRGTVVVVQEHRFELVGDDGTRRHFTLRHDAPLGWNELIALQRDRCEVAVGHDPARPGHTTAAVYSIERSRRAAAPTEQDGPAQGPGDSP